MAKIVKASVAEKYFRKFTGLSLADSAYRANIGTCTAIDTGLSVDFVNLTFGNSLYRTFANTGSAGGAIVTNFISHNSKFKIKDAKVVVLFLIANTGRR